MHEIMLWLKFYQVQASCPNLVTDRYAAQSNPRRVTSSRTAQPANLCSCSRAG